MIDKTPLPEKLQDLLKQAADTAAELSQLDGTIQGVPHYSDIELHAHELGQELPRQIQQRQTKAYVDISARNAKIQKPIGIPPHITDAKIIAKGGREE